jgi:hypothetical protein|uniref:Uncharacterized protein n=1 Tax=Phaeodactylum tricornutum TaxID=2850 RepID=A0A8J9SET0_PHATR
MVNLNPPADSTPALISRDENKKVSTDHTSTSTTMYEVSDASSLSSTLFASDGDTSDSSRNNEYSPVASKLVHTIASGFANSFDEETTSDKSTDDLSTLSNFPQEAWEARKKKTHFLQRASSPESEVTHISQASEFSPRTIASRWARLSGMTSDSSVSDSPWVDTSDSSDSSCGTSRTEGYNYSWYSLSAGNEKPYITGKSDLVKDIESDRYSFVGQGFSHANRKSDEWHGRAVAIAPAAECEVSNGVVAQSSPDQIPAGSHRDNISPVGIRFCAVPSQLSSFDRRQMEHGEIPPPLPASIAQSASKECDASQRNTCSLIEERSKIEIFFMAVILVCSVILLVLLALILEQK